MDEVTTVTLDANATPAVSVVPKAAVPEFTGNPGDFAKDMAALAAAENPPVVAVSVPEPVVQPEITESATAPATVPDKFKDASGNPDLAKIEKSTVDAQAALNKYLATEKELRKKQNEVSQLKTAPVISQPDPVAPVSPFAAQLEADMAKYGAGAVLERLFEAAKETAKNEVLSDVRADREERADIKSRNELNEIAKFDAGVLTPEGLEALAQIRADRPWLNNASNPTSEAYKVYLADQVLKARQSGVVLPTPKGLTAKVPPTPVGPSQRAVVQPAGPDLTSTSEVNAHVKNMTAEQEAAFWKSKGLRF